MSWFEHGTSRIHYEEAGSGEPVLLLPGFGDRIEAYEPLKNILVAAGFRFIAADLPGSGQSQPIPRSYPVSFYQDDAYSFAALLKHLDAAPAHLIGWSTGGEIALMMAAQTPDIARSVFTWGAGGVANNPGGQVVATMSKLIDDPIPPLQGYSQYMIATYGRDTARAMVVGQGLAITAITEQRGGDISYSKAASITCPAFLIAGEHDFFVPAPNLAQMGARIPNARTLWVEGVGHDIHIARPEWFVQTVMDWMKTGASQNTARRVSAEP